jgi:ATP-dependent helicase/nuclease subunit B
MAATLPVHIVVGAPASETGFDGWGRPDPAVWRERNTPWTTFDQSVHVVRDPDEALSLLRALIGDVQPDGDRLAICACDRETEAPRIGATLRSLGGEALDTLGHKHGDHLLHHGLQIWATLLTTADPDLAVVREAMHTPALAAAVAAQAGSAPDVDQAFHHINCCLDSIDRAFLRGSLDQVIAQIAALPPDEGADPRRALERQRLSAAREVLAAIRGFLDSLRGLTWEQSLTRGITLFIGERNLRGDDLADRFTREVADHLVTTARSIAATAAERALDLSTDALITLTLTTAAEKRFRQSDVDQAVNLPGWLEAPWDPAPHLILHGFNDHLLPRTDHAHPFLPGQLRLLVGLPSNDQTFAAAAFALEQIRRRRESTGWVDIIVPQHDAERNPLRPSRLLFLAPDDDLPARVTRLFKPAPESTLQPYWEIPPEHRFVSLATPAKRDQVCTQIRATAFKDYLADPAEFWLKYAVGLTDQELGRLELDAAGFGSLVHGALEGFGREFAGQTLDDVTLITEALLRHLDRYLARTWGDHVTAAVKIQAKAARARLLAFAPVQLKLFGEGWIIDSVEQPLPPLVLNGLAISGRYDRLDRHHDGKTWRVFDYKTFSEAKNPEKTHLGKADAAAPFTSRLAKRKADGSRGEEQIRRWKDLQLPVYHHALASTLPDVPGSPGERPRLDLGYLCLPAKAKRTGAEIWQNYAEDFQPAARAVLEAVTAQIRSGASAAFQPSERGSDYPLLPALAARPTASYLNVDQLGGQLP